MHMAMGAKSMKYISFYKCYWPQVWQYIKHANYKYAESCGATTTLEIASIFADGINNLLPAGAVIDIQEVRK